VQGPEPVASTEPNVVLVGFMATGKSSVARALAERLGRPFVDTDAEIEARHGSIPSIFDNHGEAGFRAREREVAADVAARRGLVVSTGGGMVLDPVNVATLAATGRIFCLTAEPDEILRRVLADPAAVERPLLRSDDPASRVRALLEDRASAYGAFVQIATDDLSPDEVAEIIVGHLPTAATSPPEAPAPMTSRNSSNSRPFEDSAALAAVAGLLVAAERRAMSLTAAVEVHHAGAQATRRRPGAFEVGRRHVAREPVGGVVGDADGLVLVVVGRMQSTGPKISSRAMVMSLRTSRTRSAARSSRATGPPGRPCRRHQRGAFVDALLDQPWILLYCASLTTGPIWCRGRADRPPRSVGGGRAIATATSSIGRPAPACAWARCRTGRSWTNIRDAAGHGVLEVDVVEDVGGLAAEFLRHALDRVGGALATSRPARVEPVKDIMSMSGMGRHRGADAGPSPCTRLNTPAGTPASCRISAKMDRVERGDLARLQHHGAARRQRRRHLAAIWLSGQFHGVMSPQTPIGSRTRPQRRRRRRRPGRRPRWWR
jgi:shikimate kinase